MILCTSLINSARDVELCSWANSQAKPITLLQRSVKPISHPDGPPRSKERNEEKSSRPIIISSLMRTLLKSLSSAVGKHPENDSSYIPLLGIENPVFTLQKGLHGRVVIPRSKVIAIES
jgi:hypothetical protein